METDRTFDDRSPDDRPPEGPLRLVVNRNAGDGRVRSVLPRLLDALTRSGLTYQVVETDGPAGAERESVVALQQGVRYLVAVGGDGTVNGVVNGMFRRTEGGWEPRVADAVLGVASAGTGGDLVRTFGLNRDPRTLGPHLASAATLPIDVGVVACHDHRGRPVQRLFLNIAEVGYGAHVVAAADRLPRRLGRARYLLAAWAGIRRAAPTPATLSVDHFTRDLDIVELVVANGQFFGGGMKVAPRALPDDGRFNVLAFTGSSSQVFGLTLQLYQGEHLPHPQIVEYQSAGVRLQPQRPMPVEADGELVGRTPVRFSLLPGALRMKI